MLGFRRGRSCETSGASGAEVASLPLTPPDMRPPSSRCSPPATHPRRLTTPPTCRRRIAGIRVAALAQYARIQYTPPHPNPALARTSVASRGSAEPLPYCNVNTTAELWMLSTSSLVLWPTGCGSMMSSISTIPATGVRTSWLIVARRSLRAHASAPPACGPSRSGDTVVDPGGLAVGVLHGDHQQVAFEDARIGRHDPVVAIGRRCSARPGSIRSGGFPAGRGSPPSTVHRWWRGW